MCCSLPARETCSRDLQRHDLVGLQHESPFGLINMPERTSNYLGKVARQAQ